MEAYDGHQIDLKKAHPLPTDTTQDNTWHDHSLAVLDVIVIDRVCIIGAVYPHRSSLLRTLVRKGHIQYCLKITASLVFDCSGSGKGSTC